MKAGVRQLLGFAVAIVSFVGTIIICVLPKWKVTSDSQGGSVGLWKICHNECRPYDGQPITQDLKVARALIVIAIIVGVIGILLGVAGSKFINFVPDERKKSKMAMASGVVFLIAGFSVLISICWIINGNSGNDGGSSGPKMELGASVYIGWLITGLWFLGGGLLCSSFLCRDGTD